MLANIEINRLKRFHRILRVYMQETPLDVLSQLLYFDDPLKLQQWLINLNLDNCKIDLNSKKLFITKELLIELEKYLNEVDTKKEGKDDEKDNGQYPGPFMNHVPPKGVFSNVDKDTTGQQPISDNKIIEVITAYVAENQNREIKLSYLADNLHISATLLQVMLEDMILSRDILATIEGRDTQTSNECLLVLDNEWNGEELNRKKEAIIRKVEDLVEKDDLSGAIATLRLLFTIPTVKSKERNQWNEYLAQFEQKLADPSFQILEDSQLLPREFQTMQELEKLLGEPIPQLKRLDWNSFGYVVEGHYITGISLSNKKLTILPESISDLTYLKEFYLRWNQLKTIPASVFKLSRLKKLFLEGNQLTEVSSYIGE